MKTSIQIIMMGGLTLLGCMAMAQTAPDESHKQFANPKVTGDGEPHKAAQQLLNGPGVIHAMAQAAVRVEEPGTTGIITFPIPGSYREQVPLSFTVSANRPMR